MTKVALAVKSMEHHTTNEGWEVMRGLQSAGYTLCGFGIGDGLTDVEQILERYNPTTLLLQDKREWEGRTGGPGFDRREAFSNVHLLKRRDDIFKLTVLKDAHSRPEYHRQSADEIGCHAWVVYYHPRIVYRLAPYVRPQHLIRTYHSVNPADVPEFTSEGRQGCLLSGAVSGAYPLRTRLFRDHGQLPDVTALPHPGYHRRGSDTPGFLRQLSTHKVAICTSSVYGYALRKIVEATACGCKVVTDLPTDDVLPEIDGNLVRIPSEATTPYVATLLQELYARYDPEEQRRYADAARAWYDYRAVGRRLADDIETMRAGYND